LWTGLITLSGLGEIVVYSKHNKLVNFVKVGRGGGGGDFSIILSNISVSTRSLLH
jgi:hypothetical protein